MKSKPVVLLVALTVILAFILGFRSGQKVEKTNKVVNYILSITPTPFTPNEAAGEVGTTPTPISYKEYKSKKWGLKFTYPDNLKLIESSKAAEILFEVRK